MPRFQRKGKKSGFNKKQVKQIKKIAQSDMERHREVNTLTLTNIFDNTPLKLQVIQGLAQGDGQGNRQGDEIAPFRLMCRGYVKMTGTKEGNLRLMCIQYNNNVVLTDALLPSPEEFYPDPDETTSRYKVLLDRVISLNSDGKNVAFIKFNIPAGRLSKVKFDEASTTINSGELFCYIQGDTDAATGNGYEGKLTTKLLYIDN